MEMTVYEYSGAGGAGRTVRLRGFTSTVYALYRAAPFSLTTLVTVLVINHLLLAQLDSSMSLDVFLSFRRCPKHPNTPPFDFGTPIA